MVPNHKRRQFNEDRRRVFARTREIAFVCECADDDCTASVVLAPSDYDAIRRSPAGRLLHETHRSDV